MVSLSDERNAETVYALAEESSHQIGSFGRHSTHNRKRCLIKQPSENVDQTSRSEP
jgi:hypothetical protein